MLSWLFAYFLTDWLNLIFVLNVDAAIIFGCLCFLLRLFEIFSLEPRSLEVTKLLVFILAFAL